MVALLALLKSSKPPCFPKSQLIELSSVGGEFTWTNKSLGPSRLSLLLDLVSWIELLQTLIGLTYGLNPSWNFIGVAQVIMSQ